MMLMICSALLAAATTAQRYCSATPIECATMCTVEGKKENVGIEDNSFVFGRDWNDKVAAVSVKEGCKFTAYEHKDYQGMSEEFTGGSHYDGNILSDRLLTSFKCYCLAPHDTSTAQTTTFWTEPPTTFRTTPQRWTRFRTSNTTTTTFRTTPQHWTRFRTSNTTTTTFRTTPQRWTRFMTSNTTTTTFRTEPYYSTPTTWTSYTQTTTFTSTASPTTTIGGVGGCQDKAEWCAKHVWSCKSPSDRRRNHMHTTCPKTCHLCDCKCNVQKFAPWDNGGSWCESATYSRSGRGRYGYARYVRRNFCYVAQTHSCPADEIESTLFGDDRQVISYYACTMLNNTTNSATATTTPWTRYSTTPYATTTWTPYSTTTWTPYATTPYRTATRTTTPYRTTSTTPATSTGMTSTTIPFWTATPTTTPFRTTSTTPAPSTGTTSSTFRSTPSPRPDSRLRLRFTSTTKMTIGAEDVTSTPRIMAVSSSTPSPNTQ